jgi:predicted mannosyl-3-phosphoglycerate phosphatase (HAD superfamily)
MKEKAIAEVTGLTLTKAKLANKREYSEPILWLGATTRKNEFIYWLERQGGSLLQGGRFLHLSDHCNKGRALTWLMEQFRDFLIPCELSLLAIGDSENDAAMLEVTDVALIIRSPVHAPPQLKRTTGLMISDDFGPKGWAKSVKKIVYD